MQSINGFVRCFVRVLLAGLLVSAGLALAGCAVSPSVGPPPPPTQAVTPAPDDELSWWVCRFRIHWPEGASPDWAVDLLLAHAVVKPSLEIYAERLPYWRFHRRAVRDTTGHQFSFLFYTDPATARAVYASLEASPLLGQLKAQGPITRVVKDDPEHPVRPNIEDTSDTKWSPTLQRHWPAYIMGVSQLWLGLIDDAVAEAPAETSAEDNSMAIYKAAEKRVSQIWFREGQHAFLHHLSAVFGYRELLIVKPVRF